MTYFIDIFVVFIIGVALIGMLAPGAQQCNEQEQEQEAES